MLDDFLSKNASAVFALAGALIGALGALAATWIQTGREPRFRLREKIMDRRIAAHEAIIGLSHDLRTMLSLGGVDEDGEVARAPVMLASKDSFDAFFARFHETFSSSSNWLRTDVVREVNLLQDYFVNLNEFLRSVPSPNYASVGRLIRQDFTDFSAQLEKLAHRFFTEDLEKLAMSDVGQWHKYQLEDTKKRLGDTALFVRREELNEFVVAA